MRSTRIALFCSFLFACHGVGKFVWVDDYTRPTQSEGFLIGAGDVISVRVYNQDALTTSRARVRADGRVSLPLLNDVVAAGYSPVTLGQQLETRYKEFIKLPVVTVAVDEVQPLTIPVAGEVAKPSLVTVDRTAGAGVLQVLVACGGLTDYAHKDKIFVLRRNQSQRIRFTWEALTRGEERAAGFALQQGDSVVVE